jgi:hypothetical protein
MANELAEATLAPHDCFAMEALAGVDRLKGRLMP